MGGIRWCNRLQRALRAAFHSGTSPSDKPKPWTSIEQFLASAMNDAVDAEMSPEKTTDSAPQPTRNATEGIIPCGTATA
jgi:hypothetical protein